MDEAQDSAVGVLRDAARAVFPPGPRSDRILAALWEEHERPGRHYHTLKHLSELHSVLLSVRDDLASYEHCLFACLYHDSVYDTARSDNESASALKARRELASLGFGADTIEVVSRMIVATASHESEAADADLSLFLDADLSILAAARDRYTEYLHQIRREYGWVPEAEYQAGRMGVLARFLKRESLFQTERLRARFDEPARTNIEYELELLGRSPRLSGAFQTTANGRLSFEVERARPDIIVAVEPILRGTFGFDAWTAPVRGPDQMLGECSRSGARLLYGWDNWSGFYIYAATQAEDELVRSIGEIISAALQGPPFCEYIQYY